MLIADDIQTKNNEFGFGYFITHQNHIGTYLDLSTGSPQFFFGANSTPGIVYGSGEGNYFLRDQYVPPGPLSVYLNAWLKRSTVTNHQTLDPRLSFVYHVDTERHLASDGRPSGRRTGTRQSVRAGVAQPDAVEHHADLRRPHVHRQLDQSALATGDRDRLRSGLRTPLSRRYRPQRRRVRELREKHHFRRQRPGLAVAERHDSVGAACAYIARISALCNIPPTALGIANLSVGSSFNAGLARYQGIELTGRYRVNPFMFVDYTYDIQSAAYVDIPDQVLQNNVLIIPHSQFNGTPLHKASVGLDYQSRGGFEGRIDGYYQGLYNGYNPSTPFYYANATFSQRLGKNATFNIGVQNITNSNTNNYLTFGTLPFQAENSYGTDTSAVQQQSSQSTTQQYLLPITAVFSLTYRF